MDSYIYRYPLQNVLALIALLRESIANPCMDFQKSTHINMDIRGFLDVSLQLSIQAWISTLISKHGYPCKDIPHGYPWTINIHEWMSMFLQIRLQLSMLLWISIWIYLDFYGYPCIDLLWILDPGARQNETEKISTQLCVNNTKFSIIFRITCSHNHTISAQ